MTSPHPSPGELVDLHFGESRGTRGSTVARHASECARCRAALADMEWLEGSLTTLPEEAPPPDGLDRVLARVAAAGPTRDRNARWVVPLAATVAGVGAGAGAIYAAGSWLAGASPAAATPLLESVRAASGIGMAALAFFGIGSFVTLALAPALLMEAQARRRAVAGR